MLNKQGHRNGNRRHKHEGKQMGPKVKAHEEREQRREPHEHKRAHCRSYRQAGQHILLIKDPICYRYTAKHEGKQIYCGKKISIFGESKIEYAAAAHKTKVLGRLPIDPKLTAACDRGAVEKFEGDWLDAAADLIEDL